VSVPVAAAIPDDGRTLVITRTFAAPREDVFAAWVDPEQMARWMGPRNIASQVDRMDVRPGGAYRITMRDVDTGATYVVGGIYREIVWPERLVFTWAWEEDAIEHKRGEVTEVSVVLRTVGDQTELTLQHTAFPRRAMRDNHGLGWTGGFDKLDRILADKRGRA
jgi:uncharacterized protein YndB with AHSA1/START domain